MRLLQAIANSNAHPPACKNAPTDKTTLSLGRCTTSWRNDPALVKAVRYELGKYLSGQRPDMPYYKVMDPRPRGSYYINFGNPTSPSLSKPIIWNGNTYNTVGWNAYDPDLGYGWCGEFIGNTQIMLYKLTNTGGNAIQQSSIFNDYGRYDEWSYAIENGVYNVTVYFLFGVTLIFFR